jgi:hypothetical protein
MQRDLLITDIKGFIAANVEGSVQCNQKRGRWYASEFVLNTNPMNSLPKIDFNYKGKNGSYFLDALCNKPKFYQYFDNLEEVEKFCKRKNNLIAGQQEDEMLIHGRLW